MMPVYQTVLEPPHGNCLQACIASLFELPLEDVPNFMAYGSGWRTKYRKFLKTFGLKSLLYSSREAQSLNGYHLVIGGSPRGDFLHAVVGLDGEIIHDPYPDWVGEPLTEVMGYEVIQSK
mgnify:CR=1 FL=1|jgi:hypothetical protein